MKYSITLILLLFLFSCSEESGPAAPITVNSATGTIVMTGTWQSTCITSGSDGAIQTYTFNNKILTSSIDTYPGDINCGNTPSNETIDLTLDTHGDQSLTWVINDPASLGEPVTGTRVTQTIFGIVTKFAFYVDDNTTPNVLYIGTEGLSLDGDGFPTELLDSVPYTQL